MFPAKGDVHRGMLVCKRGTMRGRLVCNRGTMRGRLVRKRGTMREGEVCSCFRWVGQLVGHGHVVGRSEMLWEGVLEVFESGQMQRRQRPGNLDGAWSDRSNDSYFLVVDHPGTRMVASKW